MSITEIIRQSIYQSVGGIAVGSIVDSLFPTAVAVDGSSALKTGAEVILQIGLAAFASNAITEFIEGRVGGLDPTHKLPFYLTMIATQPQLASKLIGISNYGKSWISEMSQIPSTPALQGVNQASYVAVPSHVTYGTGDAFESQYHDEPELE